MRIRIKGGRLIDPANGIDGQHDLCITDGRIAAVGSPDGFNPEREIDATGLVVCPGLIDLGARLREPGLEVKADIRSESRAAAAAGITTLCQPPDTDPVTDSPAVAELVAKRGRQAGMVRVLPIGALTQELRGEQLSEMADLKAAGCVAVSNAGRPLLNSQVLRRALEYAGTYDLTVFLHPQDYWLSNGGCVHEGAVSTRLGLPGIPEAAETAAVAMLVALVQQLRVRIHFCRLSSARATQMVSRARHDGLPVSADVAVHQLHLTDADIGEFNALCHVIPPLRTREDRDGLRVGVAQGVITAICSDHQPHEPDAKLAPFPSTEPGISALDTLLPLSLSLVDKGTLSLSDAIARLTSGPAEILGIEAGQLAAGALADVCIFDPDARFTLEAARMRSRGRNTPFLGRELAGRVHYTLLAGRLVHELSGAGE